jgi:GT2 family glycosyltransferase
LSAIGGDDTVAPLQRDTPSLALVIPHFRLTRFLHACLTSVLAQARVPDEIVVVDSSSDETAAIMAAFSGRVRHVVQAEKGVAAARNAGVAATRSDLVAFLDADNEALPICAARQLDAFRGDDDVVLCHGAMWVVDADGQPWPDAAPWSSEAVSIDQQLGWLLERNRIAADTVCVRRSALDAVGGFCEEPGVREDYDLWLRLAGRGRFAYVDAPLVRYRRHETNLSNDEATMFAWEAGALRRVPDETIAAALERRFGSGEARALAFAEILVRSGRTGEAKAAIEHGLVRWPEEPGFAFHAALARLDDGALAEADRLFRRVLEQAPDDLAAWNNLGVVRALDGDRVGAAAAFSRAVVRQPVYRDARANANLLFSRETEELADVAAWSVTRRRLRAVPMPLPERDRRRD